MYITWIHFTPARKSLEGKGKFSKELLRLQPVRPAVVCSLGHIMGEVSQKQYRFHLYQHCLSSAVSISKYLNRHFP